MPARSACFGLALLFLQEGRGSLSMEKMIQIQKLKKMYHGCPAVREISFQVNKGQLFALLGPNGAGKSTTINILCTAISSDGGNVVIDGLTLGLSLIHILDIRIPRLLTDLLKKGSAFLPCNTENLCGI